MVGQNLARLLKWLNRDTNHLWKRYKAVVLISPKSWIYPYARLTYTATHQTYQQQVLNL